MPFVLLVFLAAAPPDPAALDLSALPSDPDLVSVLWAHAPDLVAARARIGQAGADVVRSELLPNPTFDFQWGTIPIGPTNPTGLDRLGDVPNYTFTLNQPFEIAKRGRGRTPSAPAATPPLDALELLRQRFFDLLERVAEVATRTASRLPP
jgi:cobalt-zinc-cadmium efflux system outer membrane protein